VPALRRAIALLKLAVRCRAGPLPVQVTAMLVTAPMIARLRARPRMWAHRQIVAGRFGPVVFRRGRWAYVALAEVEAAEGIQFAAAQLAAVGHHPDHIKIKQEAA